MTNDQETSVSGCLSAPFEHVSTTFTDIETLSISETNVVAKAKRYGRWWLLKALRQERAEEAGYQQRLQKEFEILMELQHPHVVMTVGMEDVKGLGRCIVMEYVEGMTLREWLKGGHAQEALREVALQLIDAVTYIHSKGIVHRDLKPENIVVTTNGSSLKLIDFGLADTDSHAILKQPAGTPRYMSPEQHQTTVADVRNDIYSIGIILEQMDLGVSYRYIIKRCMEPIGQRYQNAAELMESMREAGIREKRLLTLLWGLLTIVLLLLTGVLTWKANEQEETITELETTMQQQQQRQLREELAQQEERTQQQQQLKSFTDTLATVKAYSEQQKEKEERRRTRKQLVKAAIGKGYDLIDSAMQQTHIDEHLDTLSDLRYLWPDFTKRSQAGLRATERYTNEVRMSFDDAENQEISYALSEHVAETIKKWNQKITDIAK